MTHCTASYLMPLRHTPSLQVELPLYGALRQKCWPGQKSVVGVVGVVGVVVGY